MRIQFLICTATAFAGAALTWASSSAQEVGEQRESRHQAVSAADRELTAFGEANPSCEIWTNWAKMCSRTGPNGEVTCVSDPDRPVRPSAPFCTGGAGASGPATTAQLASYRRFCRARSGRGAEQFRTCEGREDRPFNGRRIAARSHSWCQLWADENYDLVCQTGDLNVPNVPRCEGLARSGFEAQSKLLCVSRTSPRWCRFPRLLGGGPQYPFGEYTGPGYRIGNPTVVGVHCEGRR